MKFADAISSLVLSAIHLIYLRSTEHWPNIMNIMSRSFFQTYAILHLLTSNISAILLLSKLIL